jgi:hypothetical protein
MALPTREEMFANADASLTRALDALDSAADWLRSDWKPVGSALTDAQADPKVRMFDAIGEAKAAINRAKG